MELGIASIGFASVESIPLYHYMPGSTVTRVVVMGLEEGLYECEGPPACQYGKGAHAFETVNIPVKRVLFRASIWGTPILFLDGLEPLKALDSEKLENIFTMARSKGLKLGVRTLGLVSPTILSKFDFVVIDYVKEYSHDPSLPGEAILALKTIAKNTWTEVVAYLEEPSTDPLNPLIISMKGLRVPLHIYVRRHRGGGRIKELYQRLRRTIKYVYIHNDLYPYLDTLCPKCGAPIAHREEGFLMILEHKNGRCWKCGANLDFTGPLRKKTPERLRLIAREGGVVWYHPSQLAGRNY